MPRRQRFWTYWVLGLAWLSGAAWLLLDQYFSQRGEFGVTPHPLQGPLLLIHGVIAIASMFLFGWIAARHMTRWWRARQRRLSGGLLTGVFAALSVSGFALFFIVGDTSQRIAAITHDALGLACVGFVIEHWFFRGKRIADRKS